MRAFQISALIETAVRDEQERGIIRSKALEDAARQALEALYRWHMTDGETVELMPAFAALRAALAEPVQEPVAYTTGHCKEKAKPKGCQLHNLQCGYPKCDRKPAQDLAEPVEYAVEPNGKRSSLLTHMVNKRSKEERAALAEPVSKAQG